jgi:hypothetical protein
MFNENWMGGWWISGLGHLRSFVRASMKMLGRRIYLNFAHSPVACVSYIVGHAGGSPAGCQGRRGCLRYWSASSRKI